MIRKSIDQIKDADLHGSYAALLRAAQRAREIAARTGTRVIVSRDGVLEYLTPQPAEAREPVMPYQGKP